MGKLHSKDDFGCFPPVSSDKFKFDDFKANQF